MPILTRRFIKIAMLYLLAALLVGVILAGRPLWSLPSFLAGVGPVYFHLFMLGWVTQLIFGVVYWMFSKYSQAQPHGREGVWQTVFWLMNIGLILRVATEPMLTLNSEWGWVVALSAVMQWLAELLAVVAFSWHVWPRINPQLRVNYK